VELIVGETVQVDAANSYFFAGNIEEQIIEGWGFPRYNVSKLGPMAGTPWPSIPTPLRSTASSPLETTPSSSATTTASHWSSMRPKASKSAYRIWTAALKVTAIEKG
jgi:ecotin